MKSQHPLTSRNLREYVLIAIVKELNALASAVIGVPGKAQMADRRLLSSCVSCRTQLRPAMASRSARQAWRGLNF